MAEHREVTHKIGVTNGSVEARISGAEKSSTYALAGVEVVATYKVYGVNCQKLESLIHKVFSEAQISLSIPDRKRCFQPTVQGMSSVTRFAG